MLYHGSVIGGLSFIRANSLSHTTGKPAAYFTSDRCYALICCRAPESNFVTMGLRDDGKQHYYERFPDQLKVLYGGKHGYLYILNQYDGLTNTQGHTWESAQDMPIDRCVVIEDVYKALLQEEVNGSMIIHRYHEIDPAEQKLHANYIRDHLDMQGEEMKTFFLTHFSGLWE